MAVLTIARAMGTAVAPRGSEMRQIEGAGGSSMR